MSLKKQPVIPVVDFEKCSMNVTDKNVNLGILKRIGEEICDAFRNVGFVYIANHGISMELVYQTLQKFKEFTELPEDSKQLFSRRENGYGWTAIARESLNSARPHDLKESFSYLPQYAKEFPRCNSKVTNFDDGLAETFISCYNFSQRVLHSIGLGLKLEDPEYLCKQHNPFTEKSLTALRILHYPPVQDPNELQPGQIRCGEHSDWGSVTLLFQDDVGGLQVMSNGEFIDATPISGTLLVNIGDLMQRWTDDTFVSTVHRVLIPSDEKSYRKERQSIAFFAIPDDDCQVTSLSGSNKYPPIQTRDYMDMKMKAALYY